MQPEMNVLISVSMLGLIAISALTARKSGEWRPFYFTLAALLAFSLILRHYFRFPQTNVVSMGLREDWPLWIALYLCMLFGMLAQYGYRHFERPNRHRTKWDWGVFLAPVFASPIIFIPLATACMGKGFSLKNLDDPASAMVYLVAFENGFFWKELYDKRKEAADK